MSLGVETGIIAGASIMVSAIVAWTSARRAAFERVMATIADMTTGRTAEARHEFGTACSELYCSLKECNSCPSPEKCDDSEVHCAKREIPLL
jgi:hypothetical protein